MRQWKVKRIVASNDDGWGTTWLFDGEPILECPFYGDGRDEWVEVDETTVVRL